MNQKKKKIGIFGGSFHPIHIAHLMIAEAARDQFDLDFVIILPTGHAPHKSFQGLEEPMARLEMVRLAVEDYPGFRVSDYEFSRSQVSYTYQTLEYFSQEYPDADLYFIIGEDSLFDLETWKNPADIFARTRILVAARSVTEDSRSKMIGQIDWLKEKYQAQISLISLPAFALSSTFIREQIARGRSIRYLVPDRVEEYIRRKGLYRDSHALQYTEIEDKLRKSLKKSRFIHTQGVVETARHLARIHHYNEEKAALAALLHDCAKYMPEEERIAYCQAHQVSVNEAEEKNLTLLHAKCGAIMAKEEYGVENEEVLHAIAVHTTGQAAMNLLDQIIFVADYIEPNRHTAPHLDTLRKLADKDLNRATAQILSDTLDYLRSGGKVIDESTQKAYDYYRQYL